MRPRQVLAQLAQIEKLAEISRDHAMLAASDAVRALTASEKMHRDLANEEVAAQVGWSAAVQRAALLPELLTLWQHRLVNCQAELADSEREVAAARQTVDQARATWLRTHEKAEVLGIRVKEVRKRVEADLNESLLAGAEDMHLYRSVAG